jgi:hypothetical protein
MCKKDNSLLLLSLICIVVSLVGTLTPFSEIENEGLLDAPGSEDFLPLLVLLTLTGLSLLLTKLPSAYFTVTQLFSPLLVPPPIFN